MSEKLEQQRDEVIDNLIKMMRQCDTMMSKIRIAEAIVMVAKEMTPLIEQPSILDKQPELAEPIPSDPHKKKYALEKSNAEYHSTTKE